MTVYSSNIWSKSWVLIPGIELSAQSSKGTPPGLSDGSLSPISIAKTLS